jgi:hypothetical protein
MYGGNGREGGRVEGNGGRKEGKEVLVGRAKRG